MSKENIKSEPSKSAVIGIIAIVFLAVGYQTALFIHNAAVMRIAANRDVPDTVYVYGEPFSSGRPSPEGADRVSGYRKPGVSKRVKASHEARVEAVRRNLPLPHIESFPFDPNTVSVEDLCRLGFTPKQAEAIENYRLKGGRFRRKADFAKSYVVSDSVYARLEPYIDIPLTDLNTADSAAFDALPGIGGWFAARMISYREKLGCYSYKEQLMEIYRFDKDKFDALSDLVTVAPAHIVPYPLWTLSADSLRRHPYIGNYETARSIVLYRNNTPRSEWSVEGLSEAGVLSEDMAEKLSRCIIAAP